MDKKEVLAGLMDRKRVAILKILLGAKEELVLKEIAQKSGVPVSSTFRILQEFADANVIARRVWKTSTVYSSSQGEETDFLRELFQEGYDGVGEFVNMVENIAGVQSIILHGVKRSGKANILVIGSGIDTGKIEDVGNRVREKGFDLSYVTFTRQQYDQMSKMGLYQGEKKVLK